ncbi:hypothetical protein F4819DRAFT_490021 [Hypoxylon fuscum]|nr:hypothetical protein F4819DRAFT_490021 [Hypoxylon fuscum]
MASDQALRAAQGFTLTALSRWSVIDKKLPPVSEIKAIHVYDFDNTLFQTPLPNQKLWNSLTLSKLGSPDIFINGGWWHDPRILAATGEGVEHEEKRAWDGWWNEKIVELVRLTTKQPDALCVLLTGRAEQEFAPLIKRIVKSKGLNFDMVGLKPVIGPNHERFSSTMDFKQVFIRSLLGTYTQVEEIRIYEDRPKHVDGFRRFLDECNKQRVGLGLSRLTTEVIPVAEISTTLDPVVEVAEVQHLINIHNSLVKARPQESRNRPLIIRKSVFFTSYMIEPADTKRLIELFGSVAPRMDDLKYLANTILITAKPCPKNILDKIGGMNSKMKWEITDVGSYQQNLWAMRVRPVPANAKYHTDNPSPSVVLGLRRGARPADVNKIYHWQSIPPEKSFVFETTVGEKVMLRIEQEDQDEDQYDSRSERLFQHRSNKRKFPGDEERRPRQHGGNYGNNSNNNNNHNNNSNNNREYHSSSYQGRGGGGGENRGRGSSKGGGPSRGNRGGGGGRGNFRGGGRGGGGGGRGAAHGYRSLDDVDSRDTSHGGYGASTVSYDDTFPSLSHGGPHGGPQFPQSVPPPPQYGQMFAQQGQGQWQAHGNGNGSAQGQGQGRHGGAGAAGPDLQSLY